MSKKKENKEGRKQGRRKKGKGTRERKGKERDGGGKKIFRKTTNCSE